MNEQDLIKISSEIDTMLIKLVTTYQIPALNLTAVVLARLALMCDDLECRDDMNKLMNSVAKINKADGLHATIQ